MQAYKNWILGLCCAVLLVGLGFAQEEKVQTFDPQTAPYTESSVTKAPLQVGCWDPIEHVGDLPEWIFPMYYIRWHDLKKKKQGPDDLARIIIDGYKKGPKGRPVWIMVHAWLGNYKPADTTNLFAHKDDYAKGGTPGLWPNKAKAFWQKNTERVLYLLREANVPVDFWALDNETNIHMYAKNYAFDNTFRNMVLDPRWKTEKIPGLGITGSQLLDPKEIEGLPSDWERGTTPNSKTKGKVKDVRLAHDHVVPLAKFVRNMVMDEVMSNALNKYYPKARLSEYGKGSRLPIDWSKEFPFSPKKSSSGPPEVWRKIEKLVPDLKEVPGVGNTCSIVLYGGQGGRKAKELAGYKGDMADWLLLQLDNRIVHYDGDANQFAPWITVPNMSKKRRNLTKEEYKKLITGMAKRGVNKFLLWNPAKSSTPEGNAEMVAVLKEAYGILEKK